MGTLGQSFCAVEMLLKRCALKGNGARKVSLQWLLVVPFMAQIAIAVGLTGYLSLRNGEKTVSSLVNRLQQEVGDRVDQHLTSYLETSRQLSQSNKELFELGVLQPHQFEQIAAVFVQQMHIYPVGYLTFATLDGKLVNAGHYEDEIKITVSEINPTKYGDRQEREYSVDAADRLSQNKPPEEYVFQEEPWFFQTVQRGKPQWSPIVPWETKPYPLSVSITYPIYRGKTLIGVMDVDQRLSQISNFLRKLKVSAAGKVFVVDRQGLLVASSGSQEPYKLVDGLPQRLPATESGDRLIQATAQQLSQSFKDLRSVQQPQQLEYRLNSQRQFVRVEPWRDPLGLDWLIVVTVPESDFMAQVNANTRTTILLCILALMGAIASGIYTSRWITRPILRLIQASEKLSTAAQSGFSIGITPAPAPNIHELSVLAHDFNSMAQQLQRAFTVLEQTNTQLETLNSDLETRVEQRTQQLSEALTTVQQTQAQLIQTEKMSSLGQMVAGVAHEINNPINFIHGNLKHAEQHIRDLLKLVQLYQQSDGQDQATIRAYAKSIDLEFLQNDLAKILKSMQLGTDRVREIVLSLRNFSRLDESGFKAVDLHEGIDSTLLILNHRIKRSIEVIQDYGELPLAECYPAQLNQVFMNLLTNAIDAIEETQVESPAIRIQTQVDSSSAPDAAGSNIIIHISDNGAGISVENQTRIFDPFFTTKEVGKGTGLGLLICYQVMQKHGGTIALTSQPGQVTTFTLTLPVHQHHLAQNLGEIPSPQLG
jgi:signal transduction histidine kinase